MIINIDLTDVAAHALFNDDLTGIQRVQIEYTRAFVRLHRGHTNIYSKVHNLYHELNSLFGSEKEMTTAEIFREIRRTYGLSLPAKLAFPALVKAALGRRGFARGSAGPHLSAEDVIYVGGAFWAHPRSVRSYERAARAGRGLVVLFHDCIPVTFPDFTDGGARPFFERMLRLRARTIAVSGHTSAQVEEARRAVGAPPGLDPPIMVPLAHEFSAAKRNQASREPPSLRTAIVDRMGAFALCVGTVEIRKNHTRLMKLWGSLARQFGEGWPKLVIAGKEGWQAEEAVRLLRRAGREDPYLWIEGPTDKELIWLYGRTAFTVFPSLAEGWGMPIGESLWFGKPCVASNVTSMPEVGGDLCFYGDPHDIDTFAEPIVRLARDPEFHAKAVAWIKAAPLRTWAEAASEVAAAVWRQPCGAGKASERVEASERLAYGGCVRAPA
jgi:glycosyltransferase involved in cell wall biosynthesis